MRTASFSSKFLKDRPSIMRAAILAIGDELTCGYRLDTNSQVVARHLSAIPLDVVLHLSVEDHLAAIQSGLRTVLEAAQVIVVAGGLGPTEDDVTRQAVAASFDRSLVEDRHALERIRERFRRYGRSMPERNRVQALVPAGSEVIQNDRGTAAGFYLATDQHHLFVVPGVPYEMEGMLHDFILPRVQELAKGNDSIRRGVMKLFGLPESEIAERIRSMMARDRNPLLGLLPQRGTITIEIVARGQSGAEASALLASDMAALRQVFGRAVLCEDDRELPQVVGDLLATQGLTLAITEAAEGTGGMISTRLTEVDGHARWFRQGLVMDENPSAGDLETLASSIRESAGTDIGIATGPIIQPEEGSHEQLYGTLNAALDLNGARFQRHFTYSGERARVRQFATDATINFLRRKLMGRETAPG
jgi:nicotinamide-nucleotide amidase